MSRRLTFLAFAASMAVLVVGAMPAVARAQDDGELRLMSEPTTYTDVIDAFDEEDPFDFDLHLGFRHKRVTGDIQRQVGGMDAADGTDAFADVAEYEHIRNELDLGFDVGLYRDLAFMFRMPVVLSDERDLSPKGDNPEANLRDVRFQDPSMDTESTPLFDPQFNSPTRSGLDYIGLGLAWAIFNQYRSPELPTWLIMFEGRINVGDEMHACKKTPSGTECNPDGQDPGVSRGNNAVRAETRVSKRFRYVEPYSGLEFQMEFPGKAGDLFDPKGGIEGFMRTRPPIRGGFTAGLAVIPWEDRARYQRFTLDFRFNAQFISEGRDFSPLFDPLGSSESPYLTDPVCEAAGSNADCGGRHQLVDFRGTTNVQSHGRIGGRFRAMMRAARYVRFGLGLGVFYTTEHLLTFADPCNPNPNPQSDDPRRGMCDDGIINPHHRAAIALPGNRFKLDGALTLDLNVRAIVKF